MMLIQLTNTVGQRTEVNVEKQAILQRRWLFLLRIRSRSMKI